MGEGCQRKNWGLGAGSWIFSVMCPLKLLSMALFGGNKIFMVKGSRCDQMAYLNPTAGVLIGEPQVRDMDRKERLRLA